MKKFLAVVLVWVVILGAGVYAFKVFVLDRERSSSSSKEDEAKKPKLRLALDSFSGYCIFRSPEFKQRLEKIGINYECVDDKADYKKRMSTLENGDTPMAVFTIDALLANAPSTGDLPATIVMLIDETRGADAMVGYKQGLKDVNALNTPRARVVLTAGSPSETLFRVVRDRFELSQLPREKSDYVITANDKGVALGVEGVFREFLKAEPSEHKAFVLWEPYVSLALKEKPNAHVLVDSSKFQGYIVDVLVVQPNFLQKNRAQVQAVVQTYLELLHEKQKSATGMAELVLADAKIIEEDKINNLEIAKKVANGIWWKNTMENYAHFDLEKGKGLQSVNDMIQRITQLLNQTKDAKDPVVRVERPDKLTYDDILNKLYDDKFNLDEKISSTGTPPDADDVDWATLEKVGSFKIKSISFSSKFPDELTTDAKEMLKVLAEEIRLWPNYYLRIEGNTTNEGDPAANRELAEKRAQAVRDYLVNELNIEPFRLKAEAMEPGQGKEVRFVALQRPKAP